MNTISAINHHLNRFTAGSKIISCIKESLLYRITANRAEIFALGLITLLVPFIPVSLSALLIAATVLLFSARGRFRGVPGLPLFKQSAVFWLLLVFLSIFSVVPRQSLAVSLLYGLFILFYLMCLIELQDERKIHFLVLTFLASATLEALYGLYQHFISRPPVDPGWIDAKSFPEITVRVMGTLDNPNILAHYLVPAIILGLGLLMQRQKISLRLILGVQSALLALCLLFTWSRGGWLAFLTALLVFCLFYDRRILLLGALLLGILFWYQPDLILSRLTSATNLQDTSANYRFMVWKAALAMFRDFWFSGVGPGTAAFSKLYSQFYGISGFYAYHAHSFYLEMLVEIGLFGVAVFAWLMFSFFGFSLRNAFKMPAGMPRTVALAALAGMAGYLVHGLTENSWYNFKLVFLFWFLMALAVSAARVGKTGGENRKPFPGNPGRHDLQSPGPAARPLSVLHIISDANIGGAGRHLLTFLDYFDRSLLNVRVLCPAGSLLAPMVRARGVEVMELPQMPPDESFPLRGLYPQVKEMVRIIKKYNIQVVHTHASFAGRLAAKLAGVQLIVYTKHRIDPLAPARGWKSRLLNMVNHLTCHRVIAVSRAARDNLIQQGVAPEKIVVIYNGIDIRGFRRRAQNRPGPGKTGKGEGWPVLPDTGKGGEPAGRSSSAAPFTAGVIARLEPEKGHRYFLEAARIILEHGKNVRFFIVGTGSQEKALKEYAQELGIAGEVVFTGLREDIPEIIGGLDVVVLPSLTESLPLSLVEGMGLGKPCVASNVGGVPEIIQDGHNGLLVAPGDARGLAEMILFLLENPARARELGENAARTVEEKFDARVMAEKITNLYFEYTASH